MSFVLSLIINIFYIFHRIWINEKKVYTASAWFKPKLRLQLVAQSKICRSQVVFGIITKFMLTWQKIIYQFVNIFVDSDGKF